MQLPQSHSLSLSLSGSHFLARSLPFSHSLDLTLSPPHSHPHCAFTSMCNGSASSRYPKVTSQQRKRKRKQDINEIRKNVEEREFNVAKMKKSRTKMKRKHCVCVFVCLCDCA